MKGKTSGRKDKWKERKRRQVEGKVLPMILTMESGNNNGSVGMNDRSGKGTTTVGAKQQQQAIIQQQSPSTNGQTTTLNNNNTNCINNNTIGKVSERVSVVVISSQGSNKPGSIGSSGQVTGTVIQTTANTTGSNNQQQQSNQVRIIFCYLSLPCVD